MSFKFKLFVQQILIMLFVVGSCFTSMADVVGIDIPESVAVDLKNIQVVADSDSNKWNMLDTGIAYEVGSCKSSDKSTEYTIIIYQTIFNITAADSGESNNYLSKPTYFALLIYDNISLAKSIKLEASNLEDSIEDVKLLFAGQADIREVKICDGTDYTVKYSIIDKSSSDLFSSENAQEATNEHIAALDWFLRFLPNYFGIKTETNRDTYHSVLRGGKEGDEEDELVLSKLYIPDLGFDDLKIDGLELGVRDNDKKYGNTLFYNTLYNLAQSGPDITDKFWLEGKQVVSDDYPGLAAFYSSLSVIINAIPDTVQDINDAANEVGSENEQVYVKTIETDNVVNYFISRIYDFFLCKTSDGDYVLSDSQEDKDARTAIFQKAAEYHGTGVSQDTQTGKWLWGDKGKWEEDSDENLRWKIPLKNESHANYYTTAEEDIRIKTFYRIMRLYYKIPEDTPVNSTYLEILDGAFSFKDLSEKPDNSVIYTNDKAKYNVADLNTQANAAALLFDKRGYDSPNIRTVAFNFSNICKYYLVGASSAVTYKDDTSNSDDTTDNSTYIPEDSEEAYISGGFIRKSEVADSVTPAYFVSDTDTLIGIDSDATFSAIALRKLNLPAIPNLPSIVKRESAYNAYGKLYTSIMYMQRYAQVNYDEENKKTGQVAKYSGLKALSETEFVNEELDKIQDEIDAGKKVEEITLESSTQNYIAQYIQIYEGLDFLGFITNGQLNHSFFCDEMKAIISYYQLCKKFENVIAVVAAEEGNGETQPFKMFFNDENRSFTDNYAKGVAASATFLPLVTNTYDPQAWMQVEDVASWIDDFHYKYGFLRKALYRDTTANAAMQYYTSGNIGKLEVVTLRDFIENKGNDIVLYIDNKMYNVDAVAEMKNLAYSRMQNTEEADNESEGFFDSVSHSLKMLMDTDAESICKTGTAKVYSTKIAEKTTAMGSNKKKFSIVDYDAHIYSDEQIQDGLEKDEDDVDKAFAVVSGIYRDKSVYQIANNQAANPSPVFISSKTVPNIYDVEEEYFNQIYNYIQVINLKTRIGMNVDLEDDLDMPLFMDIYGNICTISGLVVIPSVANSTLYNASQYQPGNAAIASLYQEVGATKFRVGELTNEQMLLNKGMFTQDLDGKTMRLSIATYDNGSTISFDNIPLSQSRVKKLLYNQAYATAVTGEKATNGIGGAKYNRRVNLILEVLRGADVENIDLKKEALNGYVGIDKTGIYIGYRVEQLGQGLLSSSNGNSIIQMPNLAYLSGTSYIIAVLYRVMFCLLFSYLMILIYRDGTAGSLGIRTIYKFILNMVLTIGGIMVLPMIVNESYYTANKILLQDEAVYLQMLIREKSQQGQEIAVNSKNNQTQSGTKFYLHIEDVSIPWYKLTEAILDFDENTSFLDIARELEEEYIAENSVYSRFVSVTPNPGGTDSSKDENQPESLIEVRGSDVYANVNALFDTSDIVFVADEDDVNNTGKGHLYQKVKGENPMSFVIPYYAIIDSLLSDIEIYNSANNVEGYSVVQHTNKVTPKGLVKPYFTSFDFMTNNTNLLGLYDVYGITSPIDTGTTFTSENIETMRNSFWCNVELSEDARQAALEKLDDKVKQFVISNRGMLDKVSDETFIKVLALYASIEHNKLFKVPACNNLEIYNLDTRDIIRLSLADKSTVMRGSQKTFEKFCLDQGGAFAVILAGILEVIYWFSSLVKPAVMLLLEVVLMLSFLFRKLVRNDQNQSYFGYIISLGVICAINFAYALFLKISMTIPNFGTSIVMNLVMQIILQVLYVLLLLVVMHAVVNDSANIGLSTYSYWVQQVTNARTKFKETFMSSVVVKSLTSHDTKSGRRRRRGYTHVNRGTTRGLTGNNILSNMRNRDERRRDNAWRRR